MSDLSKLVEETLELKFMGRVRKTRSCWLWMGTTNNVGYGTFVIGRSPIGAHRAAWIFSRGPIPKGKHVLHSCDRPLCVNPKHLFLGSHRENMGDMAKKGRSPRGTMHHAARLRVCDVLNIRSMYKSGLRTFELAKKFGVSRSHVSDIVRRKKWKHI